MERRDNYLLQAQQAKKRFVTYDQQEMICRCGLSYDREYLYTTFLSDAYRIRRDSGDLQREHRGSWVEANSFAEVMTLLDWLCDSRPDRYLTGRFVNIVTQGHNFHRNLQESERDPDAEYFCADPQAFCAACTALGGEAVGGADVAYTIEVLDGVRILLKLWFADEEFPAKLVCLWEENVLRYLRYETTWYAVGLLLARIKEKMKEAQR